MKFCTHCGKELVDEAVICPSCGCSAEGSKQNTDTQKCFCTKCGAEVSADAVVCVNCGCAIKGRGSSANADALVQELSSKVKINGIIWIGIACLQILIGLFGTWFPLIVGVLNLISGINDMKYSDAVLKNPTGIVKRYESLTGPIVTLVYNIIFGGIIGVVGSVYYLVAIRSFVMSNKEAFEALDA